MAKHLAGLLEMMEAQMRLAQKEEPQLNPAPDYIPCYFHSMLQAVRCLEELVATWPPQVRRNAPLLKGFLNHGGTLIIKYIGMYRLNVHIEHDDSEVSKDTEERYEAFMDSFTTELEELSEHVIAWMTENRVDGMGEAHIKVLAACELALDQAIKCHKSRHISQLINLVDAIFRNMDMEAVFGPAHGDKLKWPWNCCERLQLHSLFLWHVQDVS